MWSFSGGGGTGTVQAPLQFMSRASYPSGAAGGGAMSDTNLGMLAALNAYNRGGSEEQHQQPEGEQHQHGGDGGGGNDGDDSAEENGNSSQ